MVAVQALADRLRPDCEVCFDRSVPKSEIVGVASIPGVAMSVRWCRNCIEHQAVPAWVADHWLDDVGLGGTVEGLAPWTLEQTVCWTDGSYIPLAEYAARRTRGT